MKILLLGDYSSLHQYLKQGLMELGYESVFLASNGDSWKKISGADLRLYPQSKGRFDKFKCHYYGAWKEAKSLRDYDIVQFINARIYKDYINWFLVRNIACNNKCISLVSAGDDCACIEAYKNKKFEYFIYDYDKSIQAAYDKNTIRGRLNFSAGKYLEKISDVIIPSLYEYKVGYDTNKVTSVIPFPINTDAIEYRENKVSGKVVFFHGINRELTKGTPFIRAAFDKLKKAYPNEVEVIMDGHMPFKQYIEVLRRTNVVVDQCCTYGYGMNACIAMAQGKVVMSGCRSETLEAFGISNTPMICTKPDVDYLYNQMANLVENRMNIPEIGYRSRKYIEELHDYIKVAEMYVHAWKTTGKI